MIRLVVLHSVTAPDQSYFLYGVLKCSWGSGDLDLSLGINFMGIRMSGKRNLLLIILITLVVQLGIVPGLSADEEDIQKTLLRMEQLLNQQQQELEAQRKELAEQRELIQQLQNAQGLPDNITEPMAPEPVTPNPSAVVAIDSPDSESVQDKPEVKLAETTEPAEEEAITDTSDSQYDAANSVFSKDFIGAWRLPGTDSAMRIGGYVNLAVVTSFDPVLIPDRFITGSIPPAGEDVAGAKSGTEVTANQTRLNLEVRQHTSGGILRAFVEGDFEGDGDTFRLRHAFGQYRFMLAGKTWTTFMDTNARPEGVDFEGINGQVLVRQPQVRIFPKFGENMSFKFALENPETDVVNGTGVKGRSDFVASVDRVPLGSLGSWNSRVAVVVRDLQAQDTMEDSGEFGEIGEDLPTESTFGWGVTTSGRMPVTRWGEDDFLLWQLTYGKGVGRYVSDLNTIGGGDAVFDEDGKLHALPVLAGFLSYQHMWAKDFWFLEKWPGIMRSNITLSWVSIDNYDFQTDRNYHSTLRTSANVIYLPTRNVRLGMELLWGKRTNVDSSYGTATQFQISARYSF